MSRRRYALLALVAMALAGAALIGSRFDLSEDGARTTARRWWPFHSENTEPVITPPEAGASSTILGTARLHDVYSRLQNSVDPAERSIAWHIWSLCVPGYVTPRDQSPDAPPAYTAGLANDALRALRVAARRRIADQCQEFSDTTRDRLRDEDSQNIERHRAGDLRSRGELAMGAVEAGNNDEALHQIAEIFRRKNPYEMRDLSGIVVRLHRQAPRASDELRDALLAVIGCDFGMDCSPDGIASLELCANGAACYGDFDDRALEAFPDIDRQALNGLRAEVSKQIRMGIFDISDFFQVPDRD